MISDYFNVQGPEEKKTRNFISRFGKGAEEDTETHFKELKRKLLLAIRRPHLNPPNSGAIREENGHAAARKNAAKASSGATSWPAHGRTPGPRVATRDDPRVV